MQPLISLRAFRDSRRLTLGLAALTLILGCRGGDQGGAAPSVLGPATAKGGSGGGGGGGSGSTSDPVVTGANPSRAPQDTTLTVAIYGSGFEIGTRALWSLDGDTTQVKVNSTKVVRSTELAANITVPLTATVSSYDIVVLTPRGKKGVGAEMFIVDEKDPTPDYTIASGMSVQADSYSATYSQGVCGVTTRIFAFASSGSGSGDAILDTQLSNAKDLKCKSYPRKLLVDYGDGVSGTASRVNVTVQGNHLHNIPIGATQRRGMNVGDIRCGGLRFKADLNDGRTVAGDSVLVTRTSESTWSVATQPPPNNRAYCLALDRSFNISFAFNIDAKKPMPVP